MRRFFNFWFLMTLLLAIVTVIFTTMTLVDMAGLSIAGMLFGGMIYMNDERWNANQ